MISIIHKELGILTMVELPDIRRRHIVLARHSLALLDNILKNVSQEQASTIRDGGDGWTILEILGHLVDFDQIFRERAQRMLTEKYPDLHPEDHDELVIERQHNKRDLGELYNELVESRQLTIAFFEGLNETEWLRAGVHPERGHFTLTDAIIQVGLHEVTHTEQLTRLLRNDY